MNDHKDYQGAKLGMWLFLFTEVLLFGGLFVLYAVYLSRYPESFHKAGQDLNPVFGTINTAVLITSSLTMALSISALQKGNVKLSKILIMLTICLALCFLTIKYFEWGAHIHHGIYPNSPDLLKLPKGEIVFYGLYYVMTGLHGVHVLIGIVVLSFLWRFVHTGKVSQNDCVMLENAGLYWHLVDLVWIYLFPLFYLIV
ncbi:MAG: cytochrome C oxidase subunit III [Acidobacteria bacterium CG_4_9_14_3_um_filter_49_7]|nr:MAG: cytochrome C oxidase subunit III [Acidobacteria bacterium CG_4_9_14_3_um_filter_49_7]